jgi:hypothetical protein
MEAIGGGTVEVTQRGSQRCRTRVSCTRGNKWRFQGKNATGGEYLWAVRAHIELEAIEMRRSGRRYYLTSHIPLIVVDHIFHKPRDFRVLMAKAKK